MSTHPIQIDLKTNALSIAETKEMWALYHPYHHYSFDSFFARIGSNTHYALYRQQGRLVGFTGLRLEKIKLFGRRYFTVYFGQTIVAPGVRGKGLINRTGIRVLRRFWLDFLTHRVVFWADALSYRAYLVFAKNLEDYYPNYRGELPESMRLLRDYLGQRYYGDSYCPEEGTVRKEQIWVRDPAMRIRAYEHSDRDISCFVAANPRYADGSGLLTLGPGHWRNVCCMLRKFRTKRQGYNPTRLSKTQQIPKPALT